MRAFSNSGTIGVHVTSACNRRCGHCYQRDYGREIDLSAVARTLAGLDFADILVYGGEPLVRPGAVRALMDAYPGKGFFLATNGTLDRRDILDRADGILLTLESFFPERQPPCRAFGTEAFRTILGVLDRYAEKTRILHNVYPEGNDPAFLRMARLRGLEVAVYPVVMPGTAWDVDQEAFRSLPVFAAPLTRPKRRVLEDGTLTRDMRGVYNGGGELPVSGKCLACDFIAACPFCSMFPHFCKDVIEAMNPVEPWFCACTRRYAHV